MSYTKLTDFASKDALLSGNPSKVIRGTEIDAEFAALETADTLSAKTGTGVSFSSITDTGNLTFTGTASRITGDFSNATVANRVMFQTSIVNGITSIGAIANGTSVSSNFTAHSSSDPANASIAQLVASATECSIYSSQRGSASFVPMVFYTGGGERIRIDTTGALGLSGANYGTAGQVLQSNGSASAPTWADLAVSNASETVAGKIEIATAAEVQTGTDTTRAVTPAGIASVAIGMGQTWQNVITTPGRALGTTYTNSSGRPIMVAVSALANGVGGTLTATCGGVSLGSSGTSSLASGASYGSFQFIVPNGATYVVTNASGMVLSSWAELRA